MSEALQILEKVNAFYSGAFSQLITFTIGLLALVGVLVPVVIAAYQSRQLKHDQKALSEKIENDLGVARRELAAKLADDLSARDESLKALIESTKLEIAKEIKKTDDLATARSFHLQALSQQQLTPAGAASDSLSAACAYARGADERNLRAVLNIWADSIEKVNADHFKLYDFDIESLKTIKALKEIDANGRYSEDIRSIKRGVEQAKQRKQPPAAG